MAKIHGEVKGKTAQGQLEEIAELIYPVLEMWYQDNPPTQHATDYNRNVALKITEVILTSEKFVRLVEDFNWAIKLLNKLANPEYLDLLGGENLEHLLVKVKDLRKQAGT